MARLAALAKQETAVQSDAEAIKPACAANRRSRLTGQKETSSHFFKCTLSETHEPADRDTRPHGLDPPAQQTAR